MKRMSLTHLKGYFFLMHSLFLALFSLCFSRLQNLQSQVVVATHTAKDTTCTVKMWRANFKQSKIYRWRYKWRKLRRFTEA